MKYSLNDGLNWIMSPVQPATTPNVNERHPAVSVTRQHPDPAITQEIHVVYEKWNGGTGNWEVYHDYTTNFGIGWFGARLMSTVGLDAIQPAIVYTEDLAFPGAWLGFANQIVWAEELGAVPGDYSIQYDAECYNGGPRLYIGPTTIRTNPAGGVFACKNPEIASVDETVNPLAYDYPFAIVWEEQMPPQQPGWPSQWWVWYADGYTTPGVVPPTAPGGFAPINVPNPAFQADALEPDIAATQDYQVVPFELYYYHITFEYRTWVGYPSPPATANSIESYYCPTAIPTPGGPAFAVWYAPVRGPTNVASYGQIDPPSNKDATEPDIAATQDYLGPLVETFFYHIDYQFTGAQNSIESHYSGGPAPNPGALSFIQTLTVQGPTAGTAYEKPTIASKLIAFNPSVFESWLAWEDSTNGATAPDIYYRMGTYVAGVGWTGWAVAPMIVGYAPVNGVEHNPELWNRNNVVFLQPLTHLVFDIDPRPVMTEVEYIDP